MAEEHVDTLRSAGSSRELQTEVGDMAAVLRKRALHQELHVAANPSAVLSDRSGGDSQYATELQCLPA